MVTQIRFEGRKVKLELLIGARLAATTGQDAHHARDQNAHHDEDAHRARLWLWYDSAQHGQRRYYKGIGKTLQPEFTSEKPQARVLADLDHAFSVMALCKRAGYSHVTLA